ncbi:hypothetical protein CASFOL_019586 [Castilleja foliolosa]|uniref:Uncharacterized protein n=1 Tax=Castilleja foliolosa TaxID=1961234 RepID=A0ABD3D5L4_9LAMI
MKKSILGTKSNRLLSIAALAGAFIIFSALLWFNYKEPKFPSLLSNHNIIEPIENTFYDDPEIHYTIDKPMFNWDEKRSDWLKKHPNHGSKNGVLVVTGSQPSPCKNPSGDYFLLRLFKNKVDYCRIHGYKIFYNNGFLEPKMTSFWAKISILKAAMLAHPEIEWLFWVDSDAIFTDMELKIPFERYEDHNNMVVHGWPNLIYRDKSWVGVNAGVFLIRNSQWAMDFLDVWAYMGPKSPHFINWGRVLRETLNDKMFPESDDQSALVYLLLKGGKKWTDKIYVENEYFLHGYWLDFANKFDEIAKKYYSRVKKLRRAHTEVASESYAAERVGGDGKRPCVTHFTGCQLCSGDINTDNSCTVGMERALNFADNQVLRNYGFVHPDIGNGSLLLPLSFD